MNRILLLRYLRGKPTRIRVFVILICCISFITVVAATSASTHYTQKQLEALKVRVGKTFWVIAVENRTPRFSIAPASSASSFSAQADESFEITELVGHKTKNPYYKVKFASGNVGFIRPEAFHEEFNLTILTLDPQADEKKKAAEQAEEEQKRVQWIKAQAWSQAVKEAALKRQAVPGMNADQVKKVAGPPDRVRKIRGSQTYAEERWLYADGSVLVFQNGLLIRLE